MSDHNPNQYEQGADACPTCFYSRPIVQQYIGVVLVGARLYCHEHAAAMDRFLAGEAQAGS